MQAFRIVVIGAGDTGTPLLQQLFNAPFVQVLGVADLNLASPGIALARAHQVAVTDDYMALVARGREVDIIIDVTGVPQVREHLRQYMVESGNSHTVIMHEQIALLMMSLSAGQWVGGKHGQQDYV
jgi:predicted homoserine dehydrogenase-like protein